MPPHSVRTSLPFPGAAPRRYEYNPFSGFVISGNANMGSLADLYGVRVPATYRVKTITDYLAESPHEQPLTGDRVSLGGVDLIVFRKCGSVVEKVVLDLAQRPLKPEQNPGLDAS